jgi:hypothetical protein
MDYYEPPKDTQICFKGALQLVENRDADGKMSTLTISADKFIVSDLVTKHNYIYNIRQVSCVGLESRHSTKCALVIWDSRGHIVVHVFDCQFATSLLLSAKDAFNAAMEP